jgi:hypothetical protein
VKSGTGTLVLGIISGVWRLPLDEITAIDEKQFVDKTGEVLVPAQRALLDAYLQPKQDIRVLNSRIALVVRDVVLANFISESLGRGPTGIYDNRA